MSFSVVTLYKIRRRSPASIRSCLSTTPPGRSQNYAISIIVLRRRDREAFPPVPVWFLPVMVVFTPSSQQLSLR